MAYKPFNALDLQSTLYKSISSHRIVLNIDFHGYLDNSLNRNCTNLCSILRYPLSLRIMDSSMYLLTFEY